MNGVSLQMARRIKIDSFRWTLPWHAALEDEKFEDVGPALEIQGGVGKWMDEKSIKYF